jgi:hypothetical protein
MKLNRHNYEEYFILYLDNELTTEDRQEVEGFVEENPDLKAELDLLLQSKLVPDTSLGFDFKEALMVRDSFSINLNNYEQWLLSYIDNELTAEEAKHLEEFIAINPAIRAELNLLQKTKIQPETIVFAGKESLYRKEEKTRVIAISWRKIAVAAVLLISVGTASVVLLKDKSSGPKADIAGRKNNETPVNNNNANEQKVIEAPSNNQLAVAPKEKAGSTPIESRSNNQVAAKNNSPVAEKERELQPANEKSFIAKNIDSKNNNLPTPENNPYVNGSSESDVASHNKTTDVIPQELLTIPKTNPDVVTASTLQPLEQSDGKKNKHRGFFRKVTRTFEKRTNMKATDGEEEDRLLIAGLAIKLN